jgi:1,4-alpha-glucan branching enzyme
MASASTTRRTEGDVLADGLREHLEREALPAFLPGQRWYAAKARGLESVRFVEALRPEGFPEDVILTLVEVRYDDGGAGDLYFLPLTLARGADADRLARRAPSRVIARREDGGRPLVVFDAMADPDACAALLEAIAADRTAAAKSGTLRAFPTSVYDRARGPAERPLEVRLGALEQSNTAVRFGDRLILKIFRRVQPGVNPDFEIGRFLSERTGFDRAPKTAGAIEFTPRGGEPSTLAILQELVPSSGTGWDHALHELREYYVEAARRTPAPEHAEAASRSVLELADADPPAAVRGLMGPYLGAAERLGRRTAELHRALASDPRDPAFAPEPIRPEDLAALRDDIRDELEATLAALGTQADDLPGACPAQARHVVAGAAELGGQLDVLAAIDPKATRIRVHGDYHLGQVLRTGDDFIILDFEGEPARPLAERRAKVSPLKDVVGMLRSFDYAAYAALFDFTKDRPEAFARLEPWSQIWRAWTCAAFWRGYRGAAGNAGFLPRDPAALAALLGAYTLDKALYELRYELNNRPDWVCIPLQGIGTLITNRDLVAPPPPPAAPAESRESIGTSAFTDFDLHLLGEGNHHRSADKLGAHFVTRDGTPGVNFAVWAPNAAAVAVVGDFNGWDPEADRLRPLARSGVWERFVPGLVPGAAYRYAVTTREGETLQKADPYGFGAELRPGTASLVRDLSGYAWGDRDWLNARRARQDLSAPVSTYEVHLGSWMRVPEEGDRWLTYRELAPRLADYAAELGFTHVELLPVSEHPFDGSWGYQQTGYFAPTSRFGTPHDFMALVDTLHQRGIGVILDWVPAHFPRDPHGLFRFDGTHLYEHADPRRGHQPDWDTAVFDFARPEVSNFLISNALFWLERYHIDGLRVDAVASMLYLDYSRGPGQWEPNVYGGRENLEAIAFLRRLNDRIHAEYPDAMVIAEESTAWPMVTRPTGVGGLGFDLKWDMGWMHDTLRYFATDPLYRKYEHNALTFRRLYAFAENFVLPLSHDEVVHGKGSLLNKMPGDAWQKHANLRLLYGWMFAQPGKKHLFMGDEFGQYREWDHDSSLDWHLLDDPLHAGLQRWVRDLNTAYRGMPALHERDAHPDGFDWAVVGDAEQSVAGVFRKGRSPEEIVLLLANFTPVPRHNYRVGVPRAGHWDEVLNSDAPLYAGGGQGNFGGARTAPVGWHGHRQSLNLTIPPLGLVALRWRSP